MRVLLVYFCPQPSLIYCACAGPLGWLLSQMLLLLFYHLDNGSNTCGIDFHFANDTEERSRTSSTSSPPADVQLAGAASAEAALSADEDPQVDSVSIFDVEEPKSSIPIVNNEILNKLFVKEFKVVSEEGR